MLAIIDFFSSICFEIVEKEEGAEVEEVEEDSEVAVEEVVVVVTVAVMGAVEGVTEVVEEEVVIVHLQTTKTEIIMTVMPLVDRLHLTTMNVIMKTTTAGMRQILGYCMVVITLIVSVLVLFADIHIH